MNKLQWNSIISTNKYLLYMLLAIFFLQYSCIKKNKTGDDSDQKKDTTSNYERKGIIADDCCKDLVNNMIRNARHYTEHDFEGMSRRCQFDFLKTARQVFDSNKINPEKGIPKENMFYALVVLYNEAGYFILQQEYQNMWVKAHNGTSVFYNSSLTGHPLTSGFDCKIKICMLEQYYNSTGYTDAGGIMCYPVIGPLQSGKPTISIMIAAGDAVPMDPAIIVNRSQFLVLDQPLYDDNPTTPSCDPIPIPYPSPSPAARISDFARIIVSPVFGLHNPRTARFYRWGLIKKYLHDNHMDPEVAGDDPNGYIGFELGYIDANMQSQIWDNNQDGSGTVLSVSPYNYVKDDMGGNTILLPLYDQSGALIYNPYAQLPRQAGGNGAGYIMEIGKPCPPYCPQ
jgi:hypothetical protein